MNEPEIGTRVIVWGRPETSLILLFGEGSYEGTTFINGNYWPTIRLNNGREVTVHQMGISVGRADQVAAQCKQFKGDVIEWDLDAYLRGEKPTPEQRTYRTTPNGSAALPPPKTASDRVLYLKQEIDFQEAKKKVALKVIEDADKTIAAKKKEIGDQTQSVIAELASMNPDILNQIAARVAEQLKAQPAQPQVMADVQPVMQPIAAPIVRPIQPEPSEADSVKLATED